MPKTFDVLFSATNYYSVEVPAESKEEAIKKVLRDWCNDELNCEIYANEINNIDSVYDNDEDLKVFEWGDSLDDGGVVVENGELLKWENGRRISLGVSDYCSVIDAVRRLD